MLNLSLYLKDIKVILPMQNIKLLVHFVLYIWDTVGYFDDPWGNLIFFFDLRFHFSFSDQVTMGLLSLPNFYLL